MILLINVLPTHHTMAHKFCFFIMSTLQHISLALTNIDNRSYTLMIKQRRLSTEYIYICGTRILFNHISGIFLSTNTYLKKPVNHPMPNVSNIFHISTGTQSGPTGFSFSSSYLHAPLYPLHRWDLGA